MTLIYVEKTVILLNRIKSSSDFGKEPLSSMLTRQVLITRLTPEK